MDGGAQLRVSLLGPFEVSRGENVLPVAGARLQGLLVRLALAAGRPVEPGVLVDAIWGDDPPAGPASALQSLVTRLRRAVSPADATADVVVQVPGGYRLAVDAEVDALRFERLSAAGRERLRAGDPEAARSDLADAVALWGDHPGAEPAAIAAVAPAVATRLAHVSIEAVTDLAEAELALGQTEAAAVRLTRLLADHPVHERAAAVLMDALAAAGRQAEALTVYERVRVALADVLGADPGTALRERHLRLLRPDAGTSAPAADVPRAPRPSHLPAPLTSFVGRADELARVKSLLATNRLVTVLGPGGAGKTRLALEAARRHRDDHRDGAWLVDLAPVTDPTKVAAAVLAAIGLRGAAVLDARKRIDGDELDVLAGELGGKRCLLLVDNCEHLIDAVAHFTAELLSRCPELRVLATSREHLAVHGEALVPLGPLALPEPGDGVEQARRAASVRLFVERAAAVRPGFEVDPSTLPLIKSVTRGLDGMPLALELAAARLRTLSLSDVAEGLSDRFRVLATGSRTAPPRHRTLRAVIAWSWDLLGEHERVVAQRIATCPGGVTPASAAALCAGTTVPAAEVPPLLDALVDRSLLQCAPGTGRYRMLETIREYGIGQLTGIGDMATTRDLAASYFTGLMARHDPQLRGPDQLTAMEVISAEYDNIVAALSHLCAAHDSRGAIALALNMTWYWQMSGGHPDGARWLAEALAVPGGQPSPEWDCARAVHLLNRANVVLGITTEQAAHDRNEMRELAHRLLGHHRLPGHHRVRGPILLALLDDEAAPASFQGLADGEDVWLSGLAHMFLGEIAENAGEPDRMRVHVEASLACFRQTGDRWGQAATLPMRAQLRRYDDLDGALADLAEARTLAGQFGVLSPGDQLHQDLRWIDLHLRRGDTGQALAVLHLARDRALHSSSVDMRFLVDVREADVRLRLGDLDRAADLLDDAERRLRDDTIAPADHARTLVSSTRAALRVAQGDLSGADTALRQAYTTALATREMPNLASVAVTAAALAAGKGQPHDSAVLLGLAARLRGAHDTTDPQIRELTRQDAEFAAAYAKGWETDPRTAAEELAARLCDSG
ncbi:SARP family transcriptional regulator [Lentzea guizhouensis]|uniref:SARP family transcriptional regulator n=1 Tax=Lentzea guizhouensis TaxID=1586287 RepID=A0A1B2HPS0_9PSEU|nr:BTAD domain-containing putative transcriptional regulator [Lentzea guizhouensis]ANZ39685.1 SARP family transcriptional regulator [Lentzea guizhouensis]